MLLFLFRQNKEETIVRNPGHNEYKVNMVETIWEPKRRTNNNK